MWFARWQGNAGVIHWEKIQEQKTIETTLRSFKLGPFTLNVPAESYIIYEYFQGSDLKHNLTASYIFLFVIMFSAMVILTIITTLRGFWYFVGMGLFILFVVALRLEVLLIGGLENMVVPGTVLLVFVGVSYFFQNIKPHIQFTPRLLTFLLLAFVLWLIIFFFAEVPVPMMHLMLTAYTPALILSVLFIIMVAHEIFVSFVYISDRGRSKSLKHFLLISVLFLANLLITCLHEMGTISWDFFYLDLYLLISLSAILGIWGFKLRENLFENIVAFNPFGAFFYLALGAMFFITCSQLLGNANDATLRVIRDFIIFTQTGFGIVFLMYIFSNFMAMMSEDFQIHNVLYKPNRMSYFTFRFAGLIVTLAFVFVSYWRDYVNHSVAGFFNYAGDLHIAQDNETSARAFYERSRLSAFQNHRANYSLAMIKASRIDFDAAANNFNLANGKRPSEFSLINQGNLHLWTKDYFPAIDQYKAAELKMKFPALNANLGFAYSKIHNVDSALFYISEARKNDQTRNTAETNFFAMVAAEIIPINADSVLSNFDTKSPEVVSNAIAAASSFGQMFETTIDPLTTEPLNLYTATLLNNYLIHNATTLDTAFTTRALAIANDSLNFGFSEALKASLAHVFYNQGNVAKAQQILAELAYLTAEYNGKYNYIMGLWALEQGSPLIAHRNFTYAVSGKYKQGRFYDAISLTEAGMTRTALAAWDSVVRHGDDGEKRVAEHIKRILNVSNTQALTLEDANKYQYARYRVSVRDTLYFSQLVKTFSDPNYKALALLDMSKKQFSSGRVKTAIRFYNETSGLQLTDKKLYDDIRHFELRMLASRYEIQNLAKQINKGIEFDASRSLEKMWYTALINESSGDTTSASKNYTILATWNPYFEDGIIASANYFRRLNPDSPKAYNILAEAIQVNATSIRLLKEYAAEAVRQGSDLYAETALETIRELESED
jgi:hypothetical protein